MKSAILSCLFLFLCLTQISAQNLKPAKWQTAIEKVSDTEYEISLTATLQNGWHIYAQNLKEVIGPVATQINIETQEGLETIGVAEEFGNLIEGYDELMGADVRKYKDEVQFVQRISCKPGIKNLKGTIRYMACDDQRCLPPKTVNFALDIPIK